jgi:LL-diaminopimelate aminotransferase
MFLNYPNNPTGACATRPFFDRLVAFAKANDIAVCYDNPYSEVVFDGQERLSFLSADGAKEVGVELNSLSKPYNMTGWRIGMAVGNPELIAAISKVKENTDSGIFNAVQFAGIRRSAARRGTRQDARHLCPAAERVLKTLAKIGSIPAAGDLLPLVPAQGMSSWSSPTSSSKRRWSSPGTA